MKKINKITEEQFNVLNESENKIEVFKEILNLDIIPNNYRIGDTAISIDNAEAFDVYENNSNNRNVYYVVINKIDNNLAFAYSFYPII